MGFESFSIRAPSGNRKKDCERLDSTSHSAACLGAGDTHIEEGESQRNQCHCQQNRRDEADNLEAIRCSEQDGSSEQREGLLDRNGSGAQHRNGKESEPDR